MDAYASEAMSSADEALEETETISMRIMEMILKIQNELRVKVTEMQSFSPEEMMNIPRKSRDLRTKQRHNFETQFALFPFPVHEARRVMQNVNKQALYMTHRSKDVSDLSDEVMRRLNDLNAKVSMARHAADSVQISITNEAAGVGGGGCLRSYRVNMTAGTSNEISLIYAIDNAEVRDGLLAYLPCSMRHKQDGREERNFMALEMVDRKIRFLWNNGAGTVAITHNVTIDTANNLATEDSMWYKITAERIGNIGRLNVRKVQPIYDRPEYHKWVVGESNPEANVLDIMPSDMLYIGGVPDHYRSNDLLSSNGFFAGTLFEISVDKERIGLWNFVSNRGCRETFIGVSDRTVDNSCYTFNGKGYAVQRNLRNYDPRYLAVSLEFKSFDENALLIFLVNQQNVSNFLRVGWPVGCNLFQILHTVISTFLFFSVNFWLFPCAMVRST